MASHNHIQASVAWKKRQNSLHYKCLHSFENEVLHLKESLNFGRFKVCFKRGKYH